MMRIHVTIYCSTITDLDGVDADNAVAALTEAMSDSCVDQPACGWSIDDVTVDVEGGES